MFGKRNAIFTRAHCTKGQRLYDKYCGTKGCGICAESFAKYYIWRGEWVVARDFLFYLHIQVDLLRRALPSAPILQAQLHMTERLIARITALLGEG